MKNKLNCLIIVLAWIAGIHPVAAQVTNLGIARAGGNSVLYWPANATNYVLQTTTTLTSPNWVMASNAVTLNAVAVTNLASSGYFRLLPSTNLPGMVLIPAGSFTIGNYLVGTNYYGITITNDPDITDANPTNVYTSAFYMDMFLVTSNQWATIYDWATNNGYFFDAAGAARTANQPEYNVNWYDAVKWCNARSAQAGLGPVYYTDALFTQIYKNGDVNAVFANWSTNGYRLPTEAEWEKAARGGLTGNRFPWGNTISRRPGRLLRRGGQLRL
jgi:formylglycine-generating enzyme required for sulfatase activity